MMVTPIAAVQFALPARCGVKAIRAALKTDLRIQADQPYRLQRTFYDTFDGRLYAAGMALERRVVGGGTTLIWEPLAGGEFFAASPTETMPRFGKDLPEGPMREGLAPILGPRALLPQADLAGTLQGLRVLNTAGRPLAQMELRKERPLGFTRKGCLSWLKLIPDPHQADQAVALGEQLVKTLPLEPLQGGDILPALEISGARPTAVTERIEVPVEAGTPAERAAKQILQGLLTTLKLNAPGVCGNLDSEFLHDFRVAIRRIRAALSQLRRALSPRAVRRFRKEFTWLGQLTSNARDLDVYLLAFDELQGGLPAELQSSFEPLRSLLTEIRDREYQVLRETLGGPRFGRLTQQFARFLARPMGSRPAAREAARPVEELARERIWALYRRAIDEGILIGPESPLDELHELRKTCKKLRYLMEFFTALFPREEILALIGGLKRFQDNLGEIQDLRVQRESLSIFAHQIQERGNALPRTPEAIDWLSNHLGERQRQAREAFQMRFDDFSREENRRGFQSLFAPIP